MYFEKDEDGDIMIFSSRNKAHKHLLTYSQEFKDNSIIMELIGPMWMIDGYGKKLMKVN